MNQDSAIRHVLCNVLCDNLSVADSLLKVVKTVSLTNYYVEGKKLTLLRCCI